MASQFKIFVMACKGLSTTRFIKIDGQLMETINKHGHPNPEDVM